MDSTRQQELTSLYYEDIRKQHEDGMRELKGNRLAMSYLVSRGVLPDTIDAFKLGSAEGGRRVMFPLYACDDGKFSTVAGFQLRAVDMSEPRYKNTQNSSFFKKGYSIFGINVAAPYIKERGVVYVVEGTFDAMAMYQRGYYNTVSIMGSHISDVQALILGELCRNAVLLFDGDAPGYHGMADACAPLVAAGFCNTIALILPGGYDPASYLSEHSTILDLDMEHLTELWIKVRSQGTGPVEAKYNLIKELVNSYACNSDKESFIDAVTRVINEV